MDLNDSNVCLEGTNEVTEPQKDTEMNNLEDNSTNNSDRIEVNETSNSEHILPQTQPVSVDLENENGNAETNIQNTDHTRDSLTEDLKNDVNETNNSEHILPQTQAVSVDLENQNGNGETNIQNTDHTRDSLMEDLKNDVNETNNSEHILPQTQAVSVDLENQNGNAETNVQNTDHTWDSLTEDLKNEDIPPACDGEPEAEVEKNEISNEAIIKIAKPLCADYRSDSDSESVDSESDSTQSSSDTMTETSSESEDDSDDSCNSTGNSNLKQEDKKEKKRELTLYDLPPIEDLRISVPEDDCVEVGTITSIVDTLVVVESYKGSAALDVDTVLFLDNGKRTLGKVFDILGPITEPVYAVRFNSQEQIKNLNIEKGLKVYYAPRTPHTTFVFMSEVLKNRGSDASWKDNAEAPPELQDFSDDEEERLHRQRHLKESDGENSSSKDENKSRKRPFTQFKQRSVQPNSFRNPNFQPTRRPNFQRYPPPNQFTPPYSHPRANSFPFSVTPYRGPGAPAGPPPMYYPPRISGPPFPAFGGIPLVNQNFLQPYFQQRAHPGPQSFGAWGNLMFRPPPPPPPPTEQGEQQPAGGKEV